MRVSYGALLIACVLLGATARGESTADAAVAEVLKQQAAAWTRGDLDAFCSVYSDDAVFVSPTGLTRGRQAVLERYRKRYSTPAEMGALTLDVIEMRAGCAGEPHAVAQVVSVVARWTLRRADGTESSGLTLLVLHNRAGRWLIEQDASM